jgi:linoleoyl-CoA desaturase
MPLYDSTFFKALKKNINIKLSELDYTRHSFEFLAVTEVIVTVSLYLFSTYMIAESDSKRTSFIFAIFLGILAARLGMLMHMGGHGSISSSRIVNNFIERCLELIGGSSIRWRFEHAYAHHIAPN